MKISLRTAALLSKVLASRRVMPRTSMLFVGKALPPMSVEVTYSGWRVNSVANSLKSPT